MTSEVNTTVLESASLKIVSALLKHKILTLKDLFLHLQSHDLESDEVLTRLFLLPHPRLVGP